MLKKYELRVNYHIVDVQVSQRPAYMAAGFEKTHVYPDSPQMLRPGIHCTRGPDGGRPPERAPRLGGR